MNTENHMVIGDPYPDSWDQEPESKEEIQERFRDYVESEISNTETHEFFMEFIETWASSELYGFALNGTIHTEFLKWLTAKFEKEFADENDLNLGEINGAEIVKELV